MFVNLVVRRVQCDEIWSFVYAKQKNVSEEQMNAGAGDCWTWTAIDADTKLIISYMLGDRGIHTAMAFMKDLAKRISNRFQLTTDGHRVYADAVEEHFGADIDYAMLVKIYGASTGVTENGSAVQPRLLHWLSHWHSRWLARSQIHQHIFRGAQQSLAENGKPQIHAPDQCLQFVHHIEHWYSVLSVTTQQLLCRASDMRHHPLV